MPTITRILRTTTGVKRLTADVCGWDNALTGRTPCSGSVPVPELRRLKDSGLYLAVWVAFLVNESREVMNVRQASQYLGISPDTLYRYITEGEIPAFKLGNRWKLRKTILDRWMERKMSQVHARKR
jgi:excisionase family DNA binding protein